MCYVELVLDQNKWIILISILLSEDYTITVDDVWEEKVRKIQRSFPSLRESNHDISAMEAADLIKDLVYKDKLLEMDEDGSDCTVKFVSDDVRHQMMSHFVLNCLKTDEDYTNYINLSSADSLLEYVRTWWYWTDKGERCLYIPERMEGTMIRRLGIDVIRHVMVEDIEDRDDKKRYNEVRQTVSETRRYNSLSITAICCINKM
jgi:hypothetical protein